MSAALLGHLLPRSSSTFDFEYDAAGQRHSLNLEAKGTRFKVTLDDKPVFEADDETFTDAGKAGVWRKADAVTLLVNLELECADLK